MSLALLILLLKCMGSNLFKADRLCIILYDAHLTCKSGKDQCCGVLGSFGCYKNNLCKSTGFQTVYNHSLSRALVTLIASKGLVRSVSEHKIELYIDSRLDGLEESTLALGIIYNELWDMCNLYN